MYRGWPIQAGKSFKPTKLNIGDAAVKFHENYLRKSTSSNVLLFLFINSVNFIASELDLLLVDCVVFTEP